MTHYVYVFLADGCSIYSPVHVECYWARQNILLMSYGDEICPGHVKVYSTEYENNCLSIQTNKKRLDFQLNIPEKEMDVGYLIKNVLGNITICQVNPCDILDEKKLVRKPTCEMERVPLIKAKESPSDDDGPMEITYGVSLNIVIWILAMFCGAFSTVKM